MKLSQDEKNTIRHQFDCYCKKILREESKNIKKKLFREYDRQKDLQDIAQISEKELVSIDIYPFEEEFFEVLNCLVSVQNENLAHALKILPKDKREIILLAYFLDMSDREIAEKLNLFRSTVQRNRTNALKILKEQLAGE